MAFNFTYNFCPLLIWAESQHHWAPPSPTFGHRTAARSHCFLCIGQDVLGRHVPRTAAMVQLDVHYKVVPQVVNAFSW